MSDVFRFKHAAAELVERSRQGLRYKASDGMFLDERGVVFAAGSGTLALAAHENPEELARQLYDAAIVERHASKALFRQGKVSRASVDVLDGIGAPSGRRFRKRNELQGVCDALAEIGRAVAGEVA